jgi:hypothetical protein
VSAEKLKKAYVNAALMNAAIIGAIILFTVTVEALTRLGYKAPLSAAPAAAVKYALYVAGLSSVMVLKLAGARLGGKKATPEETVKALLVQAAVKAAACELPAISGLVMFILTGCRADFYLLVVFSLALEVYHFPRLARWEERLRGEFGQL